MKVKPFPAVARHRIIKTSMGLDRGEKGVDEIPRTSPARSRAEVPRNAEPSFSSGVDTLAGPVVVFDRR